MFSKTLVTCALVLFHALGVIASPVLASTDDELVRIPFGGLIPKSNVHQVPEGAKVLHSPTEVKVIDAGGKIVHNVPLKNPKPFFNLPNGPNISSTIAPRSVEGVAEAVVQVNNLFSFSSTWTVPPLPQKNSGQLLMYFSALGPPSGDALVLAVMQYGVSAAGGGPFWALSSWLIVGDQAFVTNLTTVQPGASSVDLGASIINEDQFFGTPTTHAWFCVWGLITASQLNIQTAEEFNVAFNALETSGIVSDLNFPNEPTPIGDIFIQINGGASEVVPIPWQFIDDTVDGITIFDTTLSVTPEDGTMAIEYPGEI